MIEGHGDDLYRYGDKVKSNFSSNIYCRFNHDGLKEHLAGRLGCMTSYPEPSPFSLERRLARDFGVDEGCVVVTAGATDAIYRIADRFHKRRSFIMSHPTFSEYHDACKIACHDFCDDIEDAELVWICNPNNPTGEVMGKDALRGIVNCNPGKIVIIDQSYSEYTNVPLFSAADVRDMDNVILVGSFTKRFGVPGLRLGYMVGNAELMTLMRVNARPWTVSQLSIDAGIYLLDHAEEYRLPLPLLLDEARRVGELLRGAGIKANPMATPFFLCETPENATAVQLKEYLIDEHGILIRDASNFSGLSGRHFRISVQSPEENDMLIKAIERWNML
ncbi:MAG: aminotransferase class I/II-fold pyridoxal phosphate-dependent enzyme [Lachnospiraceae bacterium]|nr:aminotransferase class I/II-fold pyridoxal phosphate-dependent enzyme [Lachnospiraceae bacterium]